jgi:hypothetical protein
MLNCTVYDFSYTFHSHPPYMIMAPPVQYGSLLYFTYAVECLVWTSAAPPLTVNVCEMSLIEQFEMKQQYSRMKWDIFKVAVQSHTK